MGQPANEQALTPTVFERYSAPASTMGSSLYESTVPFVSNTRESSESTRSESHDQPATDVKERNDIPS